jgi:large subunit ribosomal protein L7/L12
VSRTIEQIAEDIVVLTVLDLSKLKTLLEDRLGVKASAPMMMAGMPAAGAPVAGAPAAAESTEFELTLDKVSDDKKIGVIKAIREVISPAPGLKEAKELVDGAPKVLPNGPYNKEKADAISKRIAEGGGKITIKGL